MIRDSGFGNYIFMLIGSILLALAVAELVLGLHFIFRYVRQQSTIWYGLFCIGSAIYVGANGLGYMTNIYFIGERIGWLGGMIATITFLPFTFTFPIAQKRASELLPWVIWPLVLFSIGLLTSDTFVEGRGIARYTTGYQTQPGELFWFMVATFLFYWAWSLSNLFRTFRKSDGVHRRNLKLVLSGIFASLVIAIGFDILLPLITASSFGYVGSLFTSVWVGVTGYIILKR